MKSFYLTLPSNASHKTYPGNTLCHYYTGLHKRLRLEGDWECALCEIHYTRSWYNVTDGTVDVYIANHEGKMQGFPLAVTPDVYQTIETLIEDLNKKKAINWRYRSEAPFDFSIHKNKVKLTLQRKTVVQLSECLRAIMGFDDKTFTHMGAGVKEFEATLYPDLSRGVTCLFVYTDIIEPRIVGDATARLLRVVPVRGEQGETTTMDLRNVHYMDVSNREFDCLEILICDDAGQKIPFTTGRVIVTLHLREKNTL
jgi:hypothetical protein